MRNFLASSSFVLASFLFTPVGADAALYTGDWDAAGVVTALGVDRVVEKSSVDILSTRFVHAGTDYFFRMDLASAPVSTGSTYLIDIGTAEDVVDYSLEAVSDGKGSFKTFYFNPWFIETSPFEVALTPASGTTKPFLEWRIARDQIIDPADYAILDSFFFSGYAYFRDIDDWTETAQATPTPIPGAVWLLGSGFVALLGLRARKKD